MHHQSREVDARRDKDITGLQVPRASANEMSRTLVLRRATANTAVHAVKALRGYHLRALLNEQPGFDPRSDLIQSKRWPL